MSTPSKKKKKPKAIVLDMDDCIVDFLKTLTMIHNRENNTCITARDIKSWNFKGLEFNDAQGNKVKGDELLATMKKYEPHGLYSILDANEDTKFAIELMNKLDYKVIILTARPKEFENQTKLNLMMHNIEYEEVIFYWDKAKMINELKSKYDIRMFIDDNYTTITAVHELCDLPFTCLMSKAHNENEADLEGVIKIRDLLESVRYLK